MYYFREYLTFDLNYVLLELMIDLMFNIFYLENFLDWMVFFFLMNEIGCDLTDWINMYADNETKQRL